MKIIPTTGLQPKFDNAEDVIVKVKDCSKWIQIDVADNVFTPTKTFELELLKKLTFKADDVLWDIHLMVKDPINWIEKCIFIGAYRIIGQVEMMSNREEFVRAVRDAGLEAGLAFDVGTEVTNIPEETDEILIMGRKAGIEKHELDNKVFEKILMAKKFEKIIAVDGGVDKNNLAKLEKAGAGIVYSETNYFEIINGTNN